MLDKGAALWYHYGVPRACAQAFDTADGTLASDISGEGYGIVTDPRTLSGSTRRKQQLNSVSPDDLLIIRDDESEAHAGLSAMWPEGR